jgi:hypothetical protein
MCWVHYSDLTKLFAICRPRFIDLRGRERAICKWPPVLTAPTSDMLAELIFCQAS